MSETPTFPLPAGKPEEAKVFGPLGHYIGFVLRSVLRHKVLSVCAFLLATTLGVAISKVVPLRYRVEATVLAQRSPGPGRDWGGPARESVIRRQNLVALCEQTHFVERYRSTRGPAARARDWVYQRLFGQERSDARVLEDLVNSLEQRLSVSATFDGTVTIGFAWSDPGLAYDVVEAALQSFLEARNRAEIGATGEVIAVLQAHDARLVSDVSAAIDRLERKKRTLRIPATAQRTTTARPQPPDEELVRIQGLLQARRRALSDLEGYRQRRLTELQMQLTEQLAIFAPDHPGVAAAQQSIETLSSPSPQATELRDEVARLEREAAARGGNAVPGAFASSSRPTLEAAREHVQAPEDPQLDLERSEVEALVTRHMKLVERIESARIELDMMQAAFEQRYAVVTPPKRPRGPMKRVDLLCVIGGIVGGIVLAFACSTALDLLGGRVVESWQVEESFGLPVLAERRR
jgi:hypothetical protein